jgi:hypothetical protein
MRRVAAPPVVPTFPAPPTREDLLRPHPTSPGEVEMQESIQRLESLGVICSPSRSRFISPPAPQVGG